MISLESVSKKFDNKIVLNDINLNVPKGHAVGMIGASGAGKTTLIKMAAGLLEPTAGRVRVMLKEPIENRYSICAKMGVFISNLPLLQKDDTVKGNFNSLQYTFRISNCQFELDYCELSKRLGFYDFQNKLVAKLSLGQRMRAELGAVLIHRPSLLLLDEPMVGLDENAKSAFREILSERIVEGLTVLMTTHDMAEISLLCKRIALLDRGNLLYYGSEHHLMSQRMPMDIMTLEFFEKLPDLQDLPLKKYMVTNNKLTLLYNTNHISSAEILKFILRQATVSKVRIDKPSLLDVIVGMQKGTL